MRSLDGIIEQNKEAQARYYHKLHKDRRPFEEYYLLLRDEMLSVSREAGYEPLARLEYSQEMAMAAKNIHEGGK